MKTISIEGTAVTPRVYFDPDKRLLEICGYSRPENARDFYDQLLDWIVEYKDFLLKKLEKDTKLDPISFKFKLIYFNSSSAKFVYDIVMLLHEMQISNIPLKIYWYFDEDDDELKEAGEELSDMANVPFHYIEVKQGEK